jgi:hypothetical protein
MRRLRISPPPSQLCVDHDVIYDFPHPLSATADLCANAIADGRPEL